MKTLKKVFIIFLIGSIVYSSGFFTFAEGQLPEGDQENQWEEVTNTSDMVEAFRYYCKSRDLTIDGSIAGMVTAVTTDIFNGLCANLGINVTQLQAEIKKSTDANKPLQYLFTKTGVTTYNRIFSQFLQDNELEVGDSVENKQIYDGNYFHDDNGNSCLVYRINKNFVTSGGNQFYDLSKSLITQYGTPLISASTMFAEIPLYSYKNYSFTIGGITYAGNLTSYQSNSNGLGISHGVNSRYFNGNEYISSNDVYWSFDVLNTEINGCLSIFKFNDKTVIGVIGVNAGWVTVNTNTFNLNGLAINNISNANIQTGNVYINAPTTINNNTYEGDTIINNNGDTNNYVPPTPPEPPQPDGGTPPDDWDIQLPDLDQDWFIHGLEKKFPFDIPFNLLFALSILNAEPETPHFEGDIDLKVTTWHYDLDLAPFEDIARYFREFQFFAFIIGLMLLTKQLIWG